MSQGFVQCIMLSLLCMLCQVAELLVGVAAPVLYWEQGHEWLFGDPVRTQVGLLPHEMLHFQSLGYVTGRCTDPWVLWLVCHLCMQS